MTAENNLQKLLSGLSPALIPGEFVFCTFEDATYADHPELEPVASVLENEGLSLVIPRPIADQNELRYDSLFRGITLRVHSSLSTVGLTAAVSSKLAEHGISANMIAGYYHDHIFVQSELADRAMTVIKELAR